MTHPENQPSAWEDHQYHLRLTDAALTRLQRHIDQHNTRNSTNISYLLPNTPQADEILANWAKGLGGDLILELQDPLKTYLNELSHHSQHLSPEEKQAKFSNIKAIQAFIDCKF